ncbi:MAG: hypothetical protein GX090_04785 [Firmicutes bacterium]|nr:hypothetical protein [Bacillota bacterium]HPZ91329.1 hypothetical protein [Bacillota bacterium]HQE02703.1 hypothetical protein [Bacillota bacterium]
MKRLCVLCLVVLALAGCSPDVRAREWAEKAGKEYWTAQYSIAFHQKDGDIEMQVREVRGDTLRLDIDMPGGSLRLEYGPDNLLISLDGGGLEWQDFPRQPPYYTLWQLSRQLAAAENLGSAGEWATVQGYKVIVRGGFPVQVRYEDQWTVNVRQFQWSGKHAPEPR